MYLKIISNVIKLINLSLRVLGQMKRKKKIKKGQLKHKEKKRKQGNV